MYHVAMLVYELAISVQSTYISAFILAIERQLSDFLDKHPNFRHFKQEMTLVDAVFEYCEY